MEAISRQAANEIERYVSVNIDLSLEYGLC